MNVNFQGPVVDFSLISRNTTSSAFSLILDQTNKGILLDEQDPSVFVCLSLCVEYSASKIDVCIHDTYC